MLAARPAQQGFTLIELLITILIIGILAAVGLAAYNGQRTAAYHAEAKTVLRNAYTAARAYHTEHDGFCHPCRSIATGGVGITLADLRRNESTISPVAAPATSAPGPQADPTRIWLTWDSAGSPPDPEWIVLCNTSRGNRSFCIARNGPVFARGSAEGDIQAAIMATFGGAGSW